MTATEMTHPRKGSGTKIIATIAILAVLGSIFLIASLALFTDSETSTGNAFSTGNIDISASPATAAITMPAMAPGDQVTEELDIGNDGTLELRYAASSVTTEDVLAGQLVLTIKENVTSCDNAGFTATGTQLYSGPLGSMAGLDLFGDAAQGSQAGDRVLAMGASETLCVNVTLPLSATNASQGLTTSAIFTFDAEQTNNNP